MSAKLINLLPSEEFESSTTGRILKWSLTSFRLMVTAVEIVVIAAFLSRFFLDAKNNDLNDKIKILQADIQGNSDFVKEFKDTQTRLTVYNKLQNDESTSSIISKIGSRLPLDVKLINITSNKDSITIKGTTANESSISQLIANLSAEDSFQKVTLSSVSSNDENVGQLDFTLNIATKEG